jgi:hypothetical protein
MPKYNLMDNEEPENTGSSGQEDQEKIPDEPAESSISDFILDDLSISDPDMKQESSPETDDEYNIPEAPVLNEQPLERTPPVDSYSSDLDYLDDKQPGINFKPFIWAAVAVVAVVLIYFAVDNLFFSGEGNETAVKTETPEERQAREREEQKQNMLAALNRENSSRLDYLTALIEIKPQDVKYSSFLLYANDLSFEAFAKDRSALARLNMQLKANPELAGYSLESAANRPGSKGGVFTLYDFKSLKPAALDTSTSAPVPSTEASTWINQAVQTFGMQLAEQRKISTRPEQLFDVTRQEFILKGSEASCFNLVKSLARNPGNYAIHKLAMVPTDQRNILKSGYQLTLIMDFYL